MATTLIKTEWKITCEELVAPHGMVAAKHPLAVEAGVKVMEAGGNAIGAAVTTAFAMNVLDPAMNGVGGGGFMLYHDATRKQNHVVDYFPFLIVGAPGGRLIMGTVMRVVHNVLDFGMGIQDACANVFLDVMGEKVMVDAALGAEALDGLQKMGYRLDIQSRNYLPHIFASPTGILVDADEKKHGGVDPYHIGIAAGY